MKKFLFLFFSFALIGCVLPFDPKLQNKTPRLVIEGQITNFEEQLVVKISYTGAYSNEGEIFLKSASGFDVKIFSEKGDFIQLFETTDKGIYKSLKPESGRVGESYFLKIITPSGEVLESSPEKLVASPKINRVFSKFRSIQIPQVDDKNIINFPNLYNGVFDVFLETQDSPQPNQFYRWEWEHYEPRSFCTVYIQQARKETNIPEKFAKVFCCNKKPCWDINKCDICPILLSDKFINGNLVANQFLGSVPFYSTSPYFMIIRQYLISESAYNFRKQLKELTSNVGGIFDYTPFTLKGNLINKSNPNDKVIGYFEVSGLEILPMELTRTNAPKPPLLPVLPETEIKNFCVPCAENQFRTTKEPYGWIVPAFQYDEEF